MKKNSDLMRGVAEPVVLKLLSGGRMYGYEIIKTVNERTGGAFEWKEGSLYPCLHRLEARGLITSQWEIDGAKPRKYYSLTRRGALELEAKVEQWQGFAANVNALLLA